MKIRTTLLKILVVCLFAGVLSAQTILSPGDVVVVAINGDVDAANNYDRGFSFMPLVNLEAGTVINFTDYGWSDVTGSFITQNTIADAFIHYTAPTSIAAGTIIRCDLYSNSNFTFDFSYAGSGNNYLNLAGLSSSDELLVFQGDRTSPTFIFAVTFVTTGWATGVPTTGISSGSGSALPGSGNASVADLADDVTALSFNQVSTANDNSAYSGTTTAATKADWQTRIQNYANWTFSDIAPIPVPPAGPFTVTGANTAPTDISLSASLVNENVAGNTAVGTLSTTDPDAGNTFTYSLVAGSGDTDNGSFNISGSSLRITNSPDYETKNSYSVRVRTTDQGGLTFEKEFTITINNQNDAPIITSNGGGVTASVNVNENTTNVTTVTATDQDPATTLTYSITGGADQAKFNINSSSGVLTFAS